MGGTISPKSLLTLPDNYYSVALCKKKFREVSPILCSSWYLSDIRFTLAENGTQNETFTPGTAIVGVSWPKNKFWVRLYTTVQASILYYHAHTLSSSRPTTPPSLSHPYYSHPISVTSNLPIHHAHQPHLSPTRPLSPSLQPAQRLGMSTHP